MEAAEASVFAAIRGMAAGEDGDFMAVAAPGH